MQGGVGNIGIRAFHRVVTDHPEMEKSARFAVIVDITESVALDHQNCHDIHHYHFRVLHIRVLLFLLFEVRSSPSSFAPVLCIQVMANDQVWHSANVPADFPTHDEIVNACTGFNRNGVSIRVARKRRFWVKYGKDSLIRGEGRTQAFVARIVNANPASVVRVPEVHLGFSRGKRGYIVMDFVQGATIDTRKSPEGDYDKKDIEAVAAAVQQLVNIKMPPGTAPGPIGGGLIAHDFFVDCLSKHVYPTVGHLKAQINEVRFLLALGTSH